MKRASIALIGALAAAVLLLALAWKLLRPSEEGSTSPIRPAANATSRTRSATALGPITLIT